MMETVVGCGMAIHREVIDDIRGTDERFPDGQARALRPALCVLPRLVYPELVVDHPFAEPLGNHLEKQYCHGRVVNPYHHIRGEHTSRWVAWFALVSSRYTRPTFAGTALRTLD